MRYSQKFERLLALFPHPQRREDPDPKRRQWRMVELERATEGELTSGYLSALRNDHIKNPGMRFLDLIAQTMGFPFELWLTEPTQWDRLLEEDASATSAAGSAGGEVEVTVAELLEQLISTISNRRTGRPFTSGEIAEYSGGRLTEQDVERMRSGDLENPSRMQLLSLCDVFGVDFSYWSAGTRMPTLSQEDIDALRLARNSSSRLLLRKTLGLDQEQMDILLLLADQLSRGSEGSPGEEERSEG